MRAKLLPVLLLILPGVAAPADSYVRDSAPASKKSITTADEYGVELVSACQEMWFLLASVSDKKQADAAAPVFRSLIDKTIELSEVLYEMEQEGEAISAELQERVAYLVEEMTVEFDSLCKLRCYGSDKLIEVCRYAMEIGMFSDDFAARLDAPLPHLSESETRAEIARLGELHAPDVAVLEALRAVKDSRTASDAVARLHAITERLIELEPDEKTQNRDFSPAARRRARKAYAPLEPVLWAIRVEIVRIASLPGYHKKEFDSFSEALENLFRSLADTHYHYFDEVFDDSFHLDLDEALRENATTSK